MRSANSLKNMSASMAAQIFNMLLSFVCRTIFIKLLATEYLGLSGLFTNVLSVLSLSELGIGNAIIIHLYKPLAEKDEYAICKYMNFYCKAYRIIGIFILLFGLVSMPFLQYIVKADTSIPHLKFIYFLFVANSAVSYFYAYKRTIITVDQKEYINTINRNAFLLIQNILQIVVLLLTHSYILYVTMMVLCTFLSNLRIAVIADKMYPFLKNTKAALDKSEILDLLKSLKAIIYHKVGNTVINSTDNIIISAVLGVYITGLYANYSMIIGIVTSFALIIFAACSASIGNLNASESSKKVFGIFKLMTFLSYWIYGFCSICFITLFQPFIELWIGSQFKIDEMTLIFIIIAFFLKGIIGISATFLDVTKLFIITRFVPWVMAIINIIVSIALAKTIGLSGIFLGTIISYVTTEFWINPYVLCKYKFEVPFYKYVGFTSIYLAVALIGGGITYFVAARIDNFILKTIVSLTIPNIIFAGCFFKTKEMRYIFNTAKTLLGTLRRKHNG